ncbi:MAG TPA: DUF998 domain-containing protein [Pseudonocardiaceae bacterium]|jgi:hypothetical membrane protein
MRTQANPDAVIEVDQVPVTPGWAERLLPVGLHGPARWVNRLLAPFALLATLVALTMVVGLHLLPGWGGVNPLTGMLSDYGVRPDGWVFDTSLDVLSVASLAVLVKMAVHGVVRSRASVLLMLAWCLCLVGIATFTKDPNLGNQTFEGSLHLWVTAAACASLPLAGIVIGWRHRKDPEWRRFAIATQVLAVLSIPCFLPFIISFFVIRFEHTGGPPELPTGLVERLMGLVDVAIVVVMALWSQRAARARRVTVS